ncbi:MAG: RagB/SusD family nutrient uptake outer membrane protein [Bacteroidales bacterium]|nr:RagB/SusD family nutrient uptake outer membrane protein [Bacteroidales bacterium]MDD4670045.1 RagB/SusD family nutrient uptake outer membrane protein [Bacteroidales bacterium]
MKKISYILMAFALLVLTSCSEFLDRSSLTTLDDQTYWSSEGNVRLFVLGAYGSYFTGYSDNWGQVYAPGVYSSGEFSDERTSSGTQSNILIAVPSDNWYKQELTYRGYWLARRGSGPWNFAYIRKWNLLLDRLNTMKENGKIADEAYNHWTGVTRFLRGWEYSRFVQSFGDVPYYDHQVATDDMDDMYKNRDPRTLVMDAVREDFDFAMANVRADDGQNNINKYVVGVIASRCMLFEGTWYIYHKNDEAMKTCSDIDTYAKKFLESARNYSQVVIDSGKYAFDTDFRTLFGSLWETPSSKEIILYREYNKSVYNSSQHCIASYSNMAEGQSTSGNLSTLKAWICQDGKPYANTTVEGADSWRLQDMVKTRDPRFEATFWDEPTSSQTGLYTVKFIDREGPTYAYNGKTRPTWYGSCTNENGFPCVRYAEAVLNWIEAKAELADKFGGAAVTQADLDKSINAIRERPLDAEAIAKGVKKTAHLMLNNLPNDPERTSSVEAATHAGIVNSPLIWEIRRERRMEFFNEQYRVLDIRRWGKLELMQGSINPDILVGGWVELDKSKNLTKKTYNLLTVANFNKVSVKQITGRKADGTLILGDRLFFNGTKDDKGNIVTSNADQMQGFLVPVNIQDREVINTHVRNYLEPICTDVITQYTEKGYTITQNPGWE